MQPNQGLKFKLNFRVYDSNIDIQKRNLALYRASFMSLFIFLMVFSPIFVYLSILYNNVNLDIYFDYYPTISQHLDLPSRLDIFGTIWASTGLTIFATVWLCFFKPIVTMDGMNKSKQLLIVIGIILVMVLALLLAALSQYYYSHYQDFFHYESLTTDNKADWVQEISAKFTTNYHEQIDIFVWQDSSIVWWVMFFQLTVVFALTVLLQNAIFSSNELLGIEQYINYSIKRQSINRSKWTRRVAQLFKITDKNLSIWLLIIAFLVMIPNFAYSILISVNGSSINALIKWTYSVPLFLQDHTGAALDHFNDLYLQMMNVQTIQANYFLLDSMPIIIMGLTFSTTFFFISVMLRGGRSDETTFSAQYIAMSLEILFLLAFFLYAKLEVEFLYNVWSSPAGLECFSSIQNLVSDKDFASITSLYSLGGVIGVKFGPMQWWSEFEIIAEAIIGVSFAICSLLGVGIGMLRSNKIASDIFKNKNNSLINLVGAKKDANKSPNQKSN